MKIDLHCHSYYSDGTQSPEFLVQRAAENQLTHLAITDHDCIAGLDSLPADLMGVSMINGVEISCGWESIEVHIVGLFFNPDNIDLIHLLESQQAARRSRVELMHKKLVALDTTGLMDYLEALPAIAYTRSHVADFLVEQKVCKTKQKSFKTHLGKGGKVYVAPDWCDLQTGIAVIKAAGGLAVLAHPGRYPINKTTLATLTTAFTDCGGEALESRYPNIDPKMVEQLERLAEVNGLYLSAGSDFHTAAAHWTDVGKFPALETSNEKGIWSHPKWYR
jgi:predicted metal-dependent phosphoesterase TrpH